jgi:hypothetical protein
MKLRAGSLDAASPRYAELLVKETRRTKDTEKPRAQLLAEWQDVGRGYGIDARSLDEQRQPFARLSPEERAVRKKQVFREAIAALSDQHAHWNEADLTKAVAERAAGRIAARDVRELVEDRLASPDLVHCGGLRTERQNRDERRYIDRIELRYSTPEIRALERKMLVSVERMIRGPQGESRKELVEAAIARRPMLQTKEGQEQAEAVRYLTSGPAVRVLSGIAGSGKTTALQACHEIWATEGREVLGCAFQKTVATRLKAALGGEVPCDTVHKTLSLLDRGELKLTARSVVLLDESAMLGTRLLARLIAHLERAPGARLVLVGDAKQLQPVTQGGAHKYLAEILGELRLTKVKRQDEVWARRRSSSSRGATPGRQSRPTSSMGDFTSPTPGRRPWPGSSSSGRPTGESKGPRMSPSSAGPTTRSGSSACEPRPSGSRPGWSTPSGGFSPTASSSMSATRSSSRRTRGRSGSTTPTSAR